MCTCENQLQPHDRMAVCPPCCVVGPGAPDCHECGHVFDGPCCCINRAIMTEREDYTHPYADELYLGGEG